MNTTITIDGKAVDNVKGVTVAIVTGDTVEPPPIDPPIDPPIEPPIPPIDPPNLGDAKPWVLISGGYQFGDTKSFRTSIIIPPEGLFLHFTTKDALSFIASFGCVERRYLPAPLNISISETVGDMTGLMNARLTSYSEFLTGSHPTLSGSIGPKCILKPNTTYFWNMKWEKPVSEFIYLSHAYRSPM